MKFFFVTIVEIKRPRWQILNLGKWMWITWLISMSQEKEKNIESLTGFEHIQFSIYTEYVPNEKTQIPCWLCPVLFPQLVYFQMSVNGMWWLWKRKNIYRGMKPIGGKNLFVIPAVILDLQRERLIVSVFLFIFLAAGFRLNPLNLPSPTWSQNKSALVQFYRKRKYWSHILLQQRINDMESLHSLAKQNHL